MSAAQAAGAAKPTGAPKETYTITSAPKRNVLMNPAAWALWGLDLGVWTASVVGPLSWMKHIQNRNTPVSREVKPADRVNTMCPTDEPIPLLPNEPEIRTAHDLMQRNCKKFAAKRCLGVRKYLGEHKPEGSRFPLKMFGETTWYTYGEVAERARNFGAGLIQVGLRPQPVGSDFETLDGPHSLLLWEDTSAEFTTALIGAGGHSIAVATSYATLGIGAVADAINEGNIRCIIGNYAQIETLTKLKSRCSSLETIIVSYHNVTDEVRAKPLPSQAGIRYISFEDVMELGKKNPVDFHAPQAETISVVMYTSGSTGAPKGVVIRHDSFVASVSGLVNYMRTGADLIEGGEAYCAYLPAAHILELIAEHAMLTIGAEMGYADPRTITSRGACRMRPDGTINTTPGPEYPPGGLQEFRPTLLAGVPKIWDIFKKAVEHQIAASMAKRFVLDVAFPARAAALAQGRDTPIFKMLFKKIASIVGGRLKIGLVGGGPCSAEVQTFVRTAFAIPFIQGYALTETCCAGCVQYISDPRNGVVGPPLTSVRIRLVECAEVVDGEGRRYTPEDTTHMGQPCVGRGEVWISGVSVSRGYYKQPEKTAEEFVEYDGRRWFRTGDVGMWTPDGCLRIIDRVKNLVKLKGGEYIAIENMESVFGTSSLIDAVNGGIMCYGDGDLDRPIAFVQVVPKQLEEWAEATGFQYKTVEELCESREAEEWVTQQLNAIGKKGGLSALELLGGVKLFAGTTETTGSTPGRHDHWTPANGLLTATSKINRKPIQQAFPKELHAAKEMYGIRP